jgi:ubiquinone/menaquinone biosynthesis C-methylase UbiE
MEAAPFFKFHRETFFAALPLQQSISLLDAGCGWGGHSRAIAKLIGSGGSVTGVDKSQTMIDAALRVPVEPGYANLKFTVGDIGQLTYSNDSFDGIICDRVFIHLENPLGVLKELRRVLKPNGWIGMTEPTWSKLELQPDSRETRLLIEAHEANFRNGSIGSQLKDLLLKSGFAIMRDEQQLYQSSDLESNWKFCNFDRTVSSLISDGRLSQVEATAFRNDLRNADESGDFHFSLLWHFCVGRKEGAVS